jgi:ATP-binding protein involved in chromosome partitioning
MSKRPLNTSAKPNKIPGVKHIIAIGSGKGGVGKSTVALNLALALQLSGLKVGLLDADIYGPNQAHLLKQQVNADIDNNRFQPVITHNLQTMSMTYLLEDESPMIWRGPMVSKALQQMLLMTQWDNCDVLIIDLPPGTGDIPLTLVKKSPVTAAIIVTTPQTLATADAEKGIAMFRKLDVPIYGIIENMSHHSCSQCGHNEHIFGVDGTKNLATKMHTDILGSLPLDQSIRETSDSGQPIVLSQPQHAISQIFSEVALKVTAKLDLHIQQNSSTFPDIVIEK